MANHLRGANSNKMALVVAVVCVIFVASLGANLVSGHEEHMEVANKQVTLRDICANRQIPIISVDEARRLINDLKRQPEVCPQNYVQSFYELEPILVLEKQDRLCSEKKFDQIKAYHFRYVNPLVEAYKLGDNLDNLDKKIVKRPLDASKVDYTVQLDDFKQEILIPISLQQFFKAWVLQVSGTCKRTLIDNLDKAEQLFSDADFNLIEQVAKPGAGLDPLAGKPLATSRLTFSELVYLPHLEGELEPGDAELRDRVTILDLRSKPEVNRLMHACQRRFKPVYAKLVLPIVRLSKLGYEYVGAKLDDINEKFVKDASVRRWMALTKICELPGNYELIESSSSASSSSSSDGDDSNQQDELKTIEELNYEPMYNYRVDGELWIKGAEALQKELHRIDGYNAKGFKKFLYKSGVAGRRVVAFIDPHQFAWYRRNQNTISSSLNMCSIISNTVSMLNG